MSSVIDMAVPAFADIVDPSTQLETLATGMRFAEGPVWRPRTGEFYWVDIVGDTIWKWSEGAGQQMVLRPSGKANGLTFDRQDRLVAAGWARRSIWRLEPDGSATILCTHHQGVRLNTPNDLVVKSDGAIYFTDPSGALYNVEMGGEDLQRYLDFHGVYRLSPQGELSLLVADFVYPNGLCFSPDESLLYINDTRQNLIRVFDVQADGSIANGRLFAQLQGSEPGRADGMKVDVRGNVYCTGPAGVHVFDPGGRQMGRIRTAHPTNLAFGGADLRTLYVTTQRTVERLPVRVPGLPVYDLGSLA